MSKKNKLSIEKCIILQEAREYCDKEDKSTEFMLQYMADKAGITIDKVIDWLRDD